MTTSVSETTQARRAVTGLRDFVPWRPVLLAWLVSRVLAVVVLMVIGSRTPPEPDITRLILMDGGWYKHIAAHGYGPPPFPGVWSVWPFFPLYPAIVSALHALGSPYSLAQIAVSTGALLVALAGLWRLAQRHVSRTAATYAVWITALFPGAITFAMGYPDALFLAAAVWAFLFIEERRPLAAGLAALLATATRPNGFIVAASLIVAVLVQARLDRRRTDRVIKSVAAVVAPSVAFLVGWMAVCWYHTGDPLVFYSAKSAWIEYTVFEAPQHWPAVFHLILAALLLVPFLVLIRRQPPSWIVLVALTIVPSLFLGVVGLGRYAVQCFPLPIAAGALMEHTSARVNRLLLVGSAAGVVVWGLLIIKASYVP
jgi:hypothetical protein